MISMNREAGSFKRWTQKRYGPYNSQTRLMYSGQSSVFIIYRARSVPDRALSSVFLFLKEYTSDLFVASIGVERVYSSFPGRAYTCVLMSASFNDARVAHSSLFREPKCLGWSFLIFLLTRAARRAGFGKNRLMTLHRSKREHTSICVVGFFNFATIFFVRFARSRRPARITRPKQCIFPAKNRHVLSWCVTCSSRSSCSTRQTC